MTRVSHTPRVGRARHAAAAGLLASAALGGLAAQSAQANVVEAQWNSPSSYTYRIVHVPDFDQLRLEVSGVLGLPNNGNFYCVPTSAMNLMAYASNHGYPFPVLGNEPWWQVDDEERYNHISFFTQVMGTRMSTIASGDNAGTGNIGNLNGVRGWLDDYYPGQFVVTQQLAAGTWAPKASDIAFISLQGGITNVIFGRYDLVGEFAGVQFVERTPGHAVTLVGLTQELFDIEFLVRDPANPPVDSIQLPFASQQWSGDNELFMVDGNVRVMTRIDVATTNMRIPIIDKYISFRPIGGLTFTNAEIPPEITFIQPNPFKATPNPFPMQFNLPSLISIAKIEPAPDLNSAAVIGSIDGIPGIGILSLDSGAFQVLTLEPTFKDATYGRFREMYVAQAQELLCYNLDAQDRDPASVDLTFPPEGIAFSDFDDQVHAVSPFGVQIASIPARFPAGADPITRPVSTDLPLGPETRILASPDDATVWLWSTQSSQLFQLELDKDGMAWSPIATAGIEGCTPESVAIADRGHLFVTCDGFVHELRPVVDAKGQIQWIVDESGVFAGLQIGHGFVPERSRTNYDPAIHAVPEWETNIDPEELEFGTPIVDCLGDLNGDRVVDADDLAILLSSFGVDYLGDLNVDQVTDADDLGLLLGVFGQECP